MKKEQDKLEEGTVAADTLKPGAGSTEGQTKAQMLSTFTQMMSQLGKEDLSKYFNDAIALIGKEADLIPSNAAEVNRKTVMTKEDVDDVFPEELSEEIKEKAAVLFEAAVNTRLILETARLEEEFEEKVRLLDEEYEVKLDEEVQAVFDDVADQVEVYMDSIVEHWIDENQVAIENSLRTQISEDFISGLRDLFKEHYIEVPEERLDILGEMKQENDDLKAKLNTVINENIEYSKVIVESTKDKVLETLSEGLAVTESERFRSLTEGLDFSDTEAFERKAKIIKENYFGKKKSTSTGMLTEEIDAELPEQKKVVPAGIAAALAAIKNDVNK